MTAPASIVLRVRRTLQPARSKRAGWGADLPLLLPAVVLVTALLVVPLILAFYFSLTDWDGFSITPPFVGVQNYRDVLNSSQVWTSVRVTVLITLICTTVVTTLSLALAALIDSAGRWSSLYRGIFFYPHIVAAIAIGFTWNAVLSPDGAANHLLSQVGLGPFPFLADPTWSLGSLIGVLVWQSTALSLVLFLAAIRSVPKEVYEAASIDGATSVQRFLHITMPYISGTITVSIVLQMAHYLRVYELVLALTNGGPAGATETIAYQILSVAYVNNALGRGSAEAVLLFVVTLALSLFIFSKRRAKDENL